MLEKVGQIVDQWNFWEISCFFLQVCFVLANEISACENFFRKTFKVEHPEKKLEKLLSIKNVPNKGSISLVQLVAYNIKRPMNLNIKSLTGIWQQVENTTKKSIKFS